MSFAGVVFVALVFLVSLTSEDGCAARRAERLSRKPLCKPQALVGHGVNVAVLLRAVAIHAKVPVAARGE